MSDIWVARIVMGIIITLFTLRVYYQYKLIKLTREAIQLGNDIGEQLRHIQIALSS